MSSYTSFTAEMPFRDGSPARDFMVAMGPFHDAGYSALVMGEWSPLLGPEPPEWDDDAAVAALTAWALTHGIPQDVVDRHLALIPYEMVYRWEIDTSDPDVLRFEYAEIEGDSWEGWAEACVDALRLHQPGDEVSYVWQDGERSGGETITANGRRTDFIDEGDGEDGEDPEDGECP